MRIGHLISNYFPSMGGAQVCIHDLAGRLVKNNHEAVVMTPRRGSGSKDSAFKYKIVRLNPLLNRLLFANFPLGKLYLEHLLLELQKKYNFDVWQITMGYPLGVASVDFFNRNNIPSILQCEGEDIQIVPEIGYGYRLNKNADRLVRENYRKFTALVAISNSVKQEYLSLNIPENKITIIPHAVHCEKFAPMRDVERKSVRKELGVEDNQKLILTAGRNHPKKGFKYIPQIIKRLAECNLDFRWLLVGKGSSSIKLLAEKEGVGSYMLINEELKPGISKSGEVEVPHNQLVRYYRASDMFVFPTLIETFGIVLVDAMAAGLPIVTTNVPGVNCIIKNNENGLMNKAGDVEALTESILKVFSDDSLAQSLRQKALMDSKNYDWSRVTESYLALYHKILEAR